MEELFGFLYARPSFLEGVARAIDIGGTLQEYNTSLSGADADRLAIQSDNLMIANDLRKSIAVIVEDKKPS